MIFKNAKALSRAVGRRNDHIIASTLRSPGIQRMAATSTTSNATSSSVAELPGYIRRLASTPRGRVSIAGVVLMGCALDYELWTWYQARHHQSHQPHEVVTEKHTKEA